MYKDITHSYGALNGHRVEEITGLRRGSRGSNRLLLALGTRLIALGERLLVSSRGARSTPLGSGA